nr:aldehyde dehydrogenase family protein [Mycobacteroides abscessus]
MFNVVLGTAATGSDLVSHPAIGLVSITGSVRAGIAVATSAAGSSSAATSSSAARHPPWCSVTSISTRPPGDRPGRLFQRRPGLYGRHPGDRARIYSRRLRQRPGHGCADPPRAYPTIPIASTGR